MREVHELDVYQLAETLSDMVWWDFDDWSEMAKRTIGYQIIRASDSIAEGYGRFTSPDKRKFYRYARGSFEETKAGLRKALRRNVITEARGRSYKKIIDALGPKLNAFIRKT